MYPSTHDLSISQLWNNKVSLCPLTGQSRTVKQNANYLLSLFFFFFFSFFSFFSFSIQCLLFFGLFVSGRREERCEVTQRPARGWTDSALPPGRERRGATRVLRVCGAVPGAGWRSAAHPRCPHDLGWAGVEPRFKAVLVRRLLSLLQGPKCAW